MTSNVNIKRSCKQTNCTQKCSGVAFASVCSVLCLLGGCSMHPQEHLCLLLTITKKVQPLPRLAHGLRNASSRPVKTVGSQGYITARRKPQAFLTPDRSLSQMYRTVSILSSAATQPCSSVWPVPCGSVFFVSPLRHISHSLPVICKATARASQLM